MKSKHYLKPEEIATLKSARRILKKLTERHAEQENKIYAATGLKAAVAEEKHEEWLDDLYESARVDFLDDDAFISLDDD